MKEALCTGGSDEPHLALIDDVHEQVVERSGLHDGALVPLRSETGRIQTAVLSAVLSDPSFRAGIGPPPPQERTDGEPVDDDSDLLLGSCPASTASSEC
ncbi:hypothetical protein [Streptomyces sp. NPDC053048]|uniref:hypothetical protein n=1 Tax=Streptomyces sp. NPDC053048 TaxID=3365694 RepID=UPI0037D7B6AB